MHFLQAANSFHKIIYSFTTPAFNLYQSIIANEVKICNAVSSIDTALELIPVKRDYTLIFNSNCSRFNCWVSYGNSWFASHDVALTS